MAAKPDKPDEGERGRKDAVTPLMPEEVIDEVLRQGTGGDGPEWHRAATQLTRSRGTPMGEA